LTHEKYVITSVLDPKSSQSESLSSEGDSEHHSITDPGFVDSYEEDMDQIRYNLREIIYRVGKIFDILEPDLSDSDYDSSDFEMDSDFTFESSDIDSEFGVGTDSESSPGGTLKPIADIKPEDLLKKNSLKLLKSIGRKLSKN